MPTEPILYARAFISNNILKKKKVYAKIYTKEFGAGALSVVIRVRKYLRRRGEAVVHKAFSARELKILKNELSARLGVPVCELPDEAFSALEELGKRAEPAVLAERVGLRRISDSELALGGAVCESRALAKVLSGCGEALLLSATLGFGIERLLGEYSLRSPSAHFFLDCAADALVEALCDRAEEEFLSGEEHTARFSPGYADLPLSFTEQIIKTTGAERILGVKLNESFFASPSKTVTAIIGIREGK